MRRLTALVVLAATGVLGAVVLFGVAAGQEPGRVYVPVAGVGGQGQQDATPTATHTTLPANTATSTAAPVNTSTATATTVPSPFATTSANVTPNTTTATIGGLVNAEGVASTVTFRFGTTQGGPYPNTVAATPGNPTGATAVSALLTGLSPDTRYYFDVQIQSSGGMASGGEQSFMTLPLPPTITSVTPFSPTNSTKPTINGTVSTNVTGVTVYGSSDCTGTLFATGSPIAGVFSLSAAVPGNTPITFSAAATNAGGTSGCSTPSTSYYADTIPPTVPGTPNLFTLDSFTGRELGIIWSPSSDNLTSASSLSYQVCLSVVSGGCSSFNAKLVITGQTSVTATGLLTGTRYYAELRVVDLAGNTSVGPEGTGQTLSNAARQIAAGGRYYDAYTCAVLADGTARCWGQNTHGQLGTGTTLSSWNPSTVGGTTPLTGIVQLVAGLEHTCALLTDSTAKCWGGNQYGQLGNYTNSGGTNANPNPLQVTIFVPYEGFVPLKGIVQLVAGNLHTCALMSDGTARCWGLNKYGQLGSYTNSGVGGGLNEPPSPPNSYPLIVGDTAPLTGIVQLTNEGHHTCALLWNGTAKCWGLNRDGELGSAVHNGGYDPNPYPLTVGGSTPLNGIVKLAGGESHTCAVLSDFTARCWGYNYVGQLGNGAFIGGFTPNPMSVIDSGGSPLAGIFELSGGGWYTCAVLADGTARCWGYNADGQLGNGTSSGGANPSPMTIGGSAPLTSVVQIDGAGGHTCAVLADGTARCWGNNGGGQLGTGLSGGRSLLPVPVLPLLAQLGGT